MTIPATVKIQNISSTALRQWVMCGLPEPVPAQWLSVSGRPAYAVGRELHIDAAMLPANDGVVPIVPLSGTPPIFRLHEWVADDLPGLVPTFRLVVDGAPYSAEAKILNLKLDGPCLKAHLRAVIQEGPVTVDCWYRIYIDSPIIEARISATYGNVAAGQPRVRAFGPLSMVTREYVHIDYAVTKGLHAPAWREANGAIHWETELVAETQWHRAQTFRVGGAVLCLPATAKFPQLVGNAEVANMQARMTAPLTAIVDKEAWVGRCGPLGVLPTLPPNAQSEQERRMRAMFDRMVTPGDALATRPYAQPPNSGQTGEQPDFGVIRGEHALAMWAPWALFDLDYSADAWALRPYANKEVDGSPVLAANHPSARTYNLRPDERFSRADMLGWPNPVGWISGWTTSDSQHRSDNLLYILWMLTQDPSLRAIIENILELEKMAYGRGYIPPPGSGLAAPRGWGRVLHSRLQGVAAGFDGFEPLAREMVVSAAVAASFTTLDPSKSVRVLSSDEEKYGWLHPDGSKVRCWLPWQESIAIIGFYEAWKLLGIPEARDLALIPAKTICRHGFFKVGEQWFTAYGVRWRTDSPGDPLPDTSYNLDQPNYDIFVYGMHRWTLPALRVLLALDPTCLEAARAEEILAYFGTPKTWDDACWGAIS